MVQEYLESLVLLLTSVKTILEIKSLLNKPKPPTPRKPTDSDDED
jgi:hypothetical protein